MKQLALLALAVTVAGTGLAACTPSTPHFAFNAAERRGRLNSNGLKFVIMPDSTTRLVEVDVRYDVGSREDPIGKAGLAHVVEHMMFQLKPKGATSSPLMHDIGELSTFFNAYTNWDSTHYQTTARADNLEALLAIESQRLLQGCKTISQDEFLREREVVRNEIRQRGGTAEGQIPQLVMSSIYPKGHAYERMIGGDDAQLTTITLPEVCDWIAAHYVPSNATLIIAGGVELEPTIAKIEKWFGGLEKRTPAPRTPVAAVQVDRQRKTFQLDVERPMVNIAWALPPANSKAGRLVRYGLNQFFFRAASKAQEYDFATSVQPGILGGELAPIFLISIELKSMDKLDEALDFVWKAAEAAHRGFDDAGWQQIEEFKNQAKASFIEEIEPLRERTNLMGDMVQFDTDFDFDSTGLYMFHALDQFEEFDGGAISSAVKKTLDPAKARVVVIQANPNGLKGDRRSKVVFQTRSHDQVVDPDVDPDEAKRPVKVAAELNTLDAAQRFTLGNGMKVVLLPIHSMPLIAADLIFDVGAATDPRDPELAAAAARFLHLPIDADAFQRTGISVGCEAGSDTTICSTSGVSIYLDIMIKGLERLIRAGAYEQEQVEGWQKQYRTAMGTKAAQEENEFRRQLLTAIYGPEHPYTVTGVVDLDAANSLGIDKLNSFKSSHYGAANATLVVVGDFDPKQAEGTIRGAFGSWGHGKVDASTSPEPYQRTGPAFIGVIGKEVPQLSIAIAYPAPAGVDGQEGARQIIAEMMNTRVADVRFKLGSTYGVYAGRRAKVGPTMYQIGGTVDAERTGESIKAMRDGLDSLRNGVNFNIDFVRARRKILQDLLGESTVTKELAQRLGFIARFGLRDTYYNTLLQQVSAASPAQLKMIIAAELAPANEVVMIAGDRPHLDKAFRDAGISDVKFVEPAYK